MDLAHVIESLNKLDSGIDEKVTLMSRDEQSVLIVRFYLFILLSNLPKIVFFLSYFS